MDTRDQQAAFTDALILELKAVAKTRLLGKIETIFIGGGTPTLLQSRYWQRLLQTMHQKLQLENLLEFTVEANPETVTHELLEILATGGVDRLSIGAQSFQPDLLKTLERHHDPANVAKSIDLARAAGIGNINLDLIFAIPGQSMEQWRNDLEAAVELAPQHLSCYSLMYEPNTALTQKLRLGRLDRVEESLEAAMYEYAIDRLAAAGFEHYEISAWSRPGHRCAHNLAYWTNANWWPLGPSASGHVDGVRWRNIPRLSDYLAQPPWPPIDQVEQLDAAGRVGEELMLRLRLREGIDRQTLQTLLADDQRGSDRIAEINKHLEAGLLQWADDCLRLTRAGLLLADNVLGDLL